MKKTTKTKTTKPKINSAEKNAEKLIEILNPSGSLSDVLTFMLKKMFPDSEVLAKKAYEMFMNEENAMALRNETKRIYLRNYSAKEIETMLKFYESKVGESILSKLSKVTNELATASREWALKIVDDSRNELEAIIEEQIALDLNREPDYDPETIVNARYSFAQRYIKKMGWDPKNLSIQQLEAIRNQEEWKNPIQ